MNGAFTSISVTFEYPPGINKGLSHLIVLYIIRAAEEGRVAPASFSLNLLFDSSSNFYCLLDSQLKLQCIKFQTYYEN